MVVLIAMRHCDNSLVMSQPLGVYTMQHQKLDVTRVGLQKSCSKKAGCSIVESINDCIYNLKACVLENYRDYAANAGGICVICEHNFDHIGWSCSGCIYQACIQVRVTRRIYERNCFN